MSDSENKTLIEAKNAEIALLRAALDALLFEVLNDNAALAAVDSRIIDRARTALDSATTAR